MKSSSTMSVRIRCRCVQRYHRGEHGAVDVLDRDSPTTAAHLLTHECEPKTATTPAVVRDLRREAVSEDFFGQRGVDARP
jgi:hypothetical protein